MQNTPLSGDSSVAAVIDEFLRSAGERRELRSALSHVSAEIGTMRLERVRARHVMALLDRLRDAGLSAKRQKAIIDALSSLYSFAIARGLVRSSPFTLPAVPRREPPEPAAPDTARTPTLTMIALGARVAIWTAWLITIGFIVLFVALAVELA
jgi:site-specific recombinase XerC